MRKYELTKESTNFYDRTLYRIKALKDFNDVKEGDLGGFIEKESNLSQTGNAWVYGDAEVSGNAEVSGRFYLIVDCDFKLPRIKIDTKQKLTKLKRFLDNFKGGYPPK